MRPVFCGNFHYDTRQSELERLFGRYGRVDRIDMKSAELSTVLTDLQRRPNMENNGNRRSWACIIGATIAYQ